MVSMQVAALALALLGAGETELLDFHATWCAPCRSTDSTVAELQQAGYPVRKVDVDRDRALARQYNVSSIPCFVLLIDGREAGRVTGVASRTELTALFTKAGVGPSRSSGTVARGQSPDPPGLPMHGRFEGSPLSPSRAGSLGVAVAPSAASSLQDLVLASVRLTIEDPQGISHGSGTIIDARQGEALILTCGHIFRDSQGKGRITVDLFGPQAPQKVPGRLISYDADKNDIGLVSIKVGADVHVAAVAPPGQAIARGDAVVSVGCNNGGPATALESKITDVDKFLGAPNLQVAGLPVQGRSGGGLFNAQGLVIGVCNAADPTDNEGLYAALAAIHAQLDRAGLTAVYAQRRVASGTPLATPGRAPAIPVVASEPRILSRGAQGPLPNPLAAIGDSTANLSEAQRTALAQMAGNDSAEVICIVRALDNPRARSEVIMLDRASTAFLRQLAVDRDAQNSRRTTAKEVRVREINPPSSR